VASKLRLRPKERILLLNSEAATEFAWFYKLLDRNERITEEIVDHLEREQQDFFERILPQVQKRAVLEWRIWSRQPVKDLGPNREEWIACALCNTANRYVFYIENIVSGKCLNVGSECVKDFGINVSHEGMTLTQLLKMASRTRLILELDKQFPKIEQTVRTWNSVLSNQPIIVPLVLEKPYVELGKLCSTVFESYVEGRAEKDGPMRMQLMSCSQF
jgi:hypothetical protein